MRDTNRVTIVGHLTRDAKVTMTPAGHTLVSFSVATNRKYKRGEEWTEQVTYHNVVTWDGDAELAAELTTGTRVHVEGRIDVRSFEKDGRKEYRTDIVAETVNPIQKTARKEEDIEPQDLPF